MMNIVYLRIYLFAPSSSDDGLLTEECGSPSEHIDSGYITGVLLPGNANVTISVVDVYPVPCRIEDENGIDEGPNVVRVWLQRWVDVHWNPQLSSEPSNRLFFFASGCALVL
jgi:hypothetical protein